MQINWITTLWSDLVIMVASVVHGIAGFGLAQVAMGVLPLVRDTQSASVIFSVVAVFANLRVWWSVREQFNWKHWIYPVIGLAAGMPLGLMVFKNLDEAQLRLAIGITLLVAVVLIGGVRQNKKLKAWIKEQDFKPGWKSGVAAGFLAGVLGGAVAIPGPPMVLYGAFLMATDQWTAKEMKGVFTAFFGTLMLYRVVSLAIGGSIQAPWLVEAATAIPAMLLGTFLGIKIYNVIPANVFRWVVLALLTVNALVLLLT